MIAPLAALALLLTPVPAPQEAPDLTTLVRDTLALCVQRPDAVGGAIVRVSDAQWALPFRNGAACGLSAEGWHGDDGALVAAARAAVGADGPDWTGPVRERQASESGLALWTRLEQVEGWAPASLLVIEPPPGRFGDVEIRYDPAG